MLKKFGVTCCVRKGRGSPIPAAMATSLKLLREISSKTSFCFFQSTTSAIGGACRTLGFECSACQITTNRPGSGYGRGGYNNGFRTLKIVLLAAISNARDKNTTTKNPGFFNKLRALSRKSAQKFSISSVIFIGESPHSPGYSQAPHRSRALPSLCT